MSPQLPAIIPKAYRKLLRLIFKFDDWHIAPLSERPYAIDIIKFCNCFIKKETFVEIGCGLGDITRNVDFNLRIGCDSDENVIRAARFLVKGKPGQSTIFRKFEFPDSILIDSMDILLMVNWIHLIDPLILKSKLQEYFNTNLNSGGMLIVDTVADKEYKFNHKIDYLTEGINCRIEKIGDYKRGREVWSISKI